MCNHTSVYDIPVLYDALPFWIIAICKSSLSQVPIFGWLLQLGGCIFVDRENTQSAIDALNDGVHNLLDYPKSVLAFPEGKIPVGEDIQPFKVGVFIFAIQTGMPVVPVAITGCRQAFGRGFNIFAKFKPGYVTINIGEPISTQNLSIYDDRHQLSQTVYKQISKLYTQKTSTVS